MPLPQKPLKIILAELDIKRNLAGLILQNRGFIPYLSLYEPLSKDEYQTLIDWKENINKNPETIRLNKLLRELNISLDRAIEFLSSYGYDVEARPTAKISPEIREVLYEEFRTDKNKREASKLVRAEKVKEKEGIRSESEAKLASKSIDDKFPLEISKTDSHISTSPELEIGQHRLLVIKEQKETYTILKESSTGETFVYRKIDYLPDENIILYVKDIDNTGKVSFDYSLFNDFRKGGKYQFNLIKTLENGCVISSGNYSSFVPPSFNSGFKNNSIELEVADIDPDKNHLIFKTFNGGDDITRENEKSPKELFEQGNKYYFEVTGTIMSSLGSEIFLLTYEGYKATVKALDFQLSEPPARVCCEVISLDENKITLRQDRYFLLKEVYHENRSYSFCIDSIEIDENTGEEYYLLSDKYGFYHRLFMNEYVRDQSGIFELGAEREFFVKRIDERGYLFLYIHSSSNSNNFYSADQVFKEMNMEELLQPFFFDLEAVIRNRRFQNQGYSILYVDYHNQENLWVFSYLSFLEELYNMACEEKAWDKALTYSKIYIGIEEWILDGSSILSDFGKEKREDIIIKAEAKLARARLKVEAIELIKSGKGEDFIKKIKTGIERTGYLRKEKKGIFKETLKADPDLLEKIEGAVIKVIGLLLQEERLDSYDFKFFNRLLENKLSRERYQLNFNLIKTKHSGFNQETIERIKEIIQAIGLQIYLYKETNANLAAVTKSATLLRYLSFLSINEDRKQYYLDHALSCLTFNIPIPIDPNEIEQIDEEWEPKISFDQGENLSQDFSGELKYVNGGAVFKTRSGIALLSQQQFYPYKTRTKLKMFKNASFFNDRVVIGGTTGNIPLKDLKDFLSYSTNWEQYFTNTNGSTNVETNNNNVPPVGTVVRVRVKNFHKSNKQLIFLEIIDEIYSGEGVLHVKFGSRIILDDLAGIFEVNDIFNAEVLKVDEKGISFGILDQVWEISKKLLTDKPLNAKVINVNSFGIFLLAENGIAGSCHRSFLPIEPEVNKTYKFQFKLQDEKHQFFNATYRSESEVHFDHKKVYRNFLEKYIIESSKQEEAVEDYNNKAFYRLITELTLVVENIIRLEKNPNEKIALLYLAKFLNSIIKHHKSYYFNAQIEFLNNAKRFKKLGLGEKFVPTRYVETETIENFENLKIINDYYKILELINQGDVREEIQEFQNTVNSGEVSRLGNLVLAYNLLREEFPEEKDTLDRTKNLIYSYISSEKIETANELLNPLDAEISHNTEETKEINLGLEGKLKEFKTSYIYYAGTHKLDPEKQALVIMKVIAGFLNAQGGSLFLGVNDSGEVCGLDEDYKELKSADQYERTIRREVVKNFGKDVNGSLDFDFKRSGKKEYLEISIPQYEEPVPLDKDFYQRQGNETRILNGNDLKMFFKRKYNAI